VPDGPHRNHESVTWVQYAAEAPRRSAARASSSATSRRPSAIWRWPAWRSTWTASSTTAQARC